MRLGKSVRGTEWALATSLVWLWLYYGGLSCFFFLIKYWVKMLWILFHQVWHTLCFCRLNGLFWFTILLQGRYEMMQWAFAVDPYHNWFAGFKYLVFQFLFCSNWTCHTISKVVDEAAWFACAGGIFHNKTRIATWFYESVYEYCWSKKWSCLI